MGAVIGGIIVLLIVADLFEKYPLASALVLGAVVFVFFAYTVLTRREKMRALQEIEDKKLRQKEEAERKEQAYKRQKFEAEQSSIKNEILGAIESVSIIIKSFPVAIKNANVYLGKAEAEYANGAFAPFWDAVEGALKCLAEFDSDTRILKDSFVRYKKNVGKYRERAPGFPDVLGSIPSAEPTVERLNSIVYRAQKNFHFASIYEQRKTNKILIAGFSSLGQALASLEDALDFSIRDMRETVERGLAELRFANETAANDIIDAVKDFKAHSLEASSKLVSEMQVLGKQAKENGERTIEQQRAVAKALKRIAMRKRH